jgi:hypothetical protein
VFGAEIGVLGQFDVEVAGAEQLAMSVRTGRKALRETRW